MVEDFGTGKIPRARLNELVLDQFDLRPGAFREELNLHRPIYQPTAAYGHFGREGDGFTWEETEQGRRPARSGERRSRRVKRSGRPMAA